MRYKRGITLIALVITIIVLLIFAGVSISTIFGEDGIIQKAGSSKEKMALAKDKEKINLIISEYKIYKLEPGSDFEEFIKDKFGEENVSETEVENVFNVTIEDSGNQYKINENGIVQEKTYEGEIAINLNPSTWTQNNVDVTINYINDSALSQEYSLDNGYSWNNYEGVFTVTENLTVKARQVDSSGNTVSKTKVIDIIDREKPSAPTFGLTASGSNGATVINLSSTDVGKSGIDTYYISIDGVNWQDASVNPTFTGLDTSATYTVRCKAVDNAGNESNISTQEASSSTVGGCITGETPILVNKDGQTKIADELNIGDEILTINPITGEFEVKPILYITKEKVENKSVANIKFSDGSNLRIYKGHRLFNVETLSYPNINVLKIDDFYNTNYYKVACEEDGVTINQAAIVGYNLESYSGYVYDFITENNLNYFANNFATCSIAMLGFPFDYDPERPLVIDYEKSIQDVEKYGLVSYEECCEIIGGTIPLEIYEKINASRLRIAMKKGKLTVSALQEGIEHLGLAGLFVKN